MALDSGKVWVKGPGCTNPSKNGLLSVVTPSTPQDIHWAISGIQWEDDLCGDGTETFIENCPPASGFTKPSERNLDFCAADPFVAIGSFDCSPIGRPADQAFETARRRLLAWEGRQVENTLWTGLSSNGVVNPSFATGNDECGITPEDLNSGGAVDASTAVSLIEAAFSDTIACGGLIHVPSSVAPYLRAHRQFIETDGGLYTASGAQFVIGTGYPGTGPANAAVASGEAWIFATGPMMVARSNVMMVPETVAEGVNRLINNITVRAERYYAVGYSCALFAVRVALTCDCADIT
jgi:hypothetical protein